MSLTAPLNMSVRFQWVKCQLDALRKCLSVSDLRKALRSLPKDLDDTYARILQDIDNKGYGDQVAKILQWLAYSAHSMSLGEIAEVLTVDMEGDPLVDFERRLEDPPDILEICSSLVSVDQGYIQFAHFSVREFLESPRLDNGPAKRFAVDEMRANMLIAESCIAYIIQVESLLVPAKSGRRQIFIDLIDENYPLWQYAGRSWSKHASNAQENERIISLCERLFQSRNTAFGRLLWLDYDLRHLTDSQGRILPIHYAIFYSLPRIMRKLVLDGADVNSKDIYGKTPLIVVINFSIHEHVEDVQFLLDHGAEVNARDDSGFTALMYASGRARVQTVQALLDNGADLEAQNGNGETALILASSVRHTEMVHLLLDRGALIDSPIGEKALGFASHYGYSEIVQILLDRGVDVDASCDLGFQGYDSVKCTALTRALAGRKYETADLLVKNGADVNARSSIKDRNAVLLEHVFANEKNLHRHFRPYSIGKDGIEQHRGKMFRFLIEHGADPKLVRADHMNLEAQERFRNRLSDFDIDLSLE